MEKVINLLNDIETKADKILGRVSDEKNKLNEESNQKMKAFEAKVKKDTDKKLAAIRNNAELELTAELSKLKQEHEVFLKQLDEDFDTNCEQYASQIVDRILSLT